MHPLQAGIPPRSDNSAAAPLPGCERALHRCAFLGTCSEETDQLTRTFLSAPVRDVHEAVRDWMQEAGMTVRIDAVGNIIGRWAQPGAPDAPVLLLGSHLDTIRGAGLYDGALGVLAGIEVAAALHRAGLELPFTLEVVGFSEEEGVRFRTPYLGSRALAGTFDQEHLSLRDDKGATLAETITAYGLDPSQIPAAAYAPGVLAGYIELHIEQGPCLEAMGQPLGVVDAIAGQSRLTLRLSGQAGHAGTYPMELRQDALTGAAEIALAIESLAAADTTGLVATVGAFSVEPNVSNVIPGVVVFSMDIRHRDDHAREAAVRQALQAAQEIASRRRLTLAVEREQHFPAVPMDSELRDVLSNAVMMAIGSDPPLLTSGAGHDAAVLAPITPTAMLFIRSPGGISHHPDETVLPGDVQDAITVLTNCIALLAERENLAAAPV